MKRIDIHRLIPSILMVLFLLLAAKGVQAQVADSLKTPANIATDTISVSSPETPGFGAMLVRTIVSLAFVVLLVYAGMYGLKRMAFRRKKSSLGGLRISGSIMLGARRSVYMVDVEDRRLVLGVTDTQINLLTELDKDLAAETVESGQKDTSFPTFKDYFGRLFNKRETDEA